MICYSLLFRILKRGEQNSAAHTRAIQHQQPPGHDSNQQEAADYESDFKSESGRTESEVMKWVPIVSSGSEEVVYSDTFSDVSSSYTSQSPDHSGGASSRTSRSRDGRFERRDSARRVFKDAVVQTQLAPPTYSWTAGRCTSQEKSSWTMEKAPGHCGCSCSILFSLCLQVCPLLEVRPGQIRRHSSHTWARRRWKVQDNLFVCSEERRPVKKNNNK